MTILEKFFLNNDKVRKEQNSSDNRILNFFSFHRVGVEHIQFTRKTPQEFFLGSKSKF
jgi:hypothetical protein